MSKTWGVPMPWSEGLKIGDRIQIREPKLMNGREGVVVGFEDDQPLVAVEVNGEPFTALPYDWVKLP